MLSLLDVYFRQCVVFLYMMYLEFSKMLARLKLTTEVYVLTQMQQLLRVLVFNAPPWTDLPAPFVIIVVKTIELIFLYIK